MSQFGNGSLAMNFSRERLLEIIYENRSKHAAEYEAALKGYFIECRVILKKWYDDITDGKPINLFISETMPENHTSDYDRVIRMLELTTEPEIRLTQELFDQYVMDNWVWKKNWSASNSKYLSNVSD
jgi:hypothetical protein